MKAQSGMHGKIRAWVGMLGTFMSLVFNLYSSCVLPSRTAFNLYRTKVTFAVTQVKV
jgi:hypothetical protein